jgi:hypothetical protein
MSPIVYDYRCSVFCYLAPRDVVVCRRKMTGNEDVVFVNMPGV